MFLANKNSDFVSQLVATYIANVSYKDVSYKAVGQNTWRTL